MHLEQFLHAACVLVQTFHVKLLVAILRVCTEGDGQKDYLQAKTAQQMSKVDSPNTV